MTGFADLFFRSSKTPKEASAGNAAGAHNVVTKLSCTARHKSDDLNGFIKFRVGLSLKKEAQQHFGRSLSFVLRQLLCAYIDKENLPTRKEAETLKRLAFEAHKIGVNLNQAVKVLNADPKNAKRGKELMSLTTELSELKKTAMEAMRGLNEKTPS